MRDSINIIYLIFYKVGGSVQNTITQSIDTPIIIACAIASVLTTLIPILVSIVLLVRKKINTASYFCGVGTFFISQVVLRIPILSLLTTFVPSYKEFSSTMLGVILIGGLSAGLFEETARLIGAKVLSKHDDVSLKDSISLGLGHSLCEVILITGITYVVHFTVLIMINSNTFETFMSALSEQAINDQLKYYTSLTVLDYVLGIMERCSAIMLHIIDTMLVFYGVKIKKYRYYLLAIAIHTVFNSLAVILSTYTGYTITEVVLLILSVTGIVVTVKTLKGRL